MMNLPKEAEKAVLEAIYTDRKIIAWKLYNDATRVGLAESKRFVLDLDKNLRRQYPERFTGPGSVNILYIVQAIEFSMITGDPDLPWDGVDDMVQALSAGKKSEAVAQYQELSGQSPDEARKAMDAVEEVLRDESEIPSNRRMESVEGEPRQRRSSGPASPGMPSNEHDPDTLDSTGRPTSRWTMLWRSMCSWIRTLQRRTR